MTLNYIKNMLNFTKRNASQISLSYHFSPTGRANIKSLFSRASEVPRIHHHCQLIEEKFGPMYLNDKSICLSPRNSILRNLFYRYTVLLTYNELILCDILCNNKSLEESEYLSTENLLKVFKQENYLGLKKCMLGICGEFYLLQVAPVSLRHFRPYLNKWIQLVIWRRRDRFSPLCSANELGAGESNVETL
jgi:hypothetical protein